MNKKSYIQIFFCKYPEVGKVKTRLAKTIGYELSTELYKAILNHVIRKFPKENTVIFLDDESYKKEIKEPYFKKSFSEYRIYKQRGKDLGEKMANAFLEIFSLYKHIDYIFLTGSDVPEYDYVIVKKYFDILIKESYDSCIVPSNDGGYSMIGFSKKFYKKNKTIIYELFKNIEWSTENVLSKQLKYFKDYKLKYKIFEPLNDLDDFDDLLKFCKYPFIRRMIENVYVLIPVLNEEENLKILLPKIKQNPFVKEIICIDNGSEDATINVCKNYGATVLKCPIKGYGAALLTAIEELKTRNIDPNSIILFMDGDGSDDPEEINKIILPLLSNHYDLILGDRSKSKNLLLHQKFGNKLATFLIFLFWRYKYQDLGPMRALKWKKLLELNMQDKNFGWTIEMQIKAIKNNFRIKEVIVNYHKRFSGKSKVSGTIRGSILAGIIIIRTILKLKLQNN
jgi:rSAM/selenodomain-associated transferase 1